VVELPGVQGAAPAEGAVHGSPSGPAGIGRAPSGRSVASRTDSTPASLHARTTNATALYDRSRDPRNSTTSPGLAATRSRIVARSASGGTSTAPITIRAGPDPCGGRILISNWSCGLSTTPVLDTGNRI